MIERALRELNPVPDELIDYDVDRAAADLERILTLPRPTAPARRRTPHHAHGRRLAVIAVASVAALLLVLGVPFGPWRTSPPAVAATPPLLSGELAAGVSGDQARAQLERIADAAARSNEAGRLGSKYSTWSLHTRVQGGDVVRSAVVPIDVTFEVNADRSGSLLAVYGDAVAGDPEGDDVPTSGTVQTDQTFGPGQAALMYPAPLSGDPAALRKQLEAGHPVDANGPAELFIALADLCREQTPSPPVRAAAARVLAQTGEIASLGVMKDRDGRLGQAFAIDSDFTGLPTRYVIVLDPRSGRLLAAEQVLTTTSGRLDLKVPAVIDYQVFEPGT